MPLYEYRCKACGKVFEKMVRWSEADCSPVCPNCQGQDTQKKVSTIAAIGTTPNSSGGAGCGTGGSRFS